MNIEGKRAVVTGGSRGIGLGIVESLVDRKAKVIVVARDKERLAEVERRFGVTTLAGDITDEAFAHTVIREVKPDVLVLNAGRPPAHGLIHEQSWEQFTSVWEHDVKAGLYWIQAAIKAPLAKGSRVVVTSSGAAVEGSPMSGGYAGAKRMLWLMAKYANVASAELDLGIKFQTIVQMQIIPTGVGVGAAQAYAKRKGVGVEAFYANFGKALTPKDIGDHVVEILTDPKHENGLAFAMKGDTGLKLLEG
jgi:NADP-dependent 3-hydroxy acid dehydrogenase YdfG